MAMIATIAIVAAELDASNATINKKARTTIVERNEHRRDVKVSRNDRERCLRDEAHTDAMDATDATDVEAATISQMA